MTKSDLAADLKAAHRGRSTITSRKGTPAAVTLDEAYEMGRELERERVSAGWRPTGWKLGLGEFKDLWARL